MATEEHKSTSDLISEWLSVKKSFNCECIECGHKMTSNEHCNKVKCPECGGEMRRAERPGPGR